MCLDNLVPPGGFSCPHKWIKPDEWVITKQQLAKINHNRERIRNLQHIFKECLRNEAFEKCAELEDTILNLEIENLISNSIIAY